MGPEQCLLVMSPKTERKNNFGQFYCCKTFEGLMLILTDYLDCLDSLSLGLNCIKIRLYSVAEVIA